MPQTLLTFLDRWALVRHDDCAFRFLNVDGQENEELSFGELREKALEVAKELVKRELDGKRVILSFPPGLDFIIAFFGCMYAKAIAVPLPPPRSKRQLTRNMPILKDACPTLILTKKGIEFNVSLPELTIEECYVNHHFEYPKLDISENDIAFLQYTSGSTSLPKGVVLRHHHLLQQQIILKKAFGHNDSTKIVGWLPVYHDMGLIGNVLQAIYLGVTTNLMSPLTFIQQPFRWLEAISNFSATTSGGPNFAYQLCLSKITDSQLASLDLSSWKLAFNGSERIRSDTLKAFANRFSIAGFNLSSFFPCYGLAEATLFVTGAKKVLSCSYKTTTGYTSDVVSCGRPENKDQLLIVNPDTLNICPDGFDGEIWVKGDSVASGYWNNIEESKKTFEAFTASHHGPFLRTGDTGFLKDGDLYVLGRLKNLLILRGKNYYPHDLEMCVKNAHPLLENTQGVVVSSDKKEGEQLVVVQEIDRSLKNNVVADELFRAIKQTLFEEFEIAPSEIVFVKQNSLPRTTSGKLQHHLVAKQFQEKNLGVLFSWPKESKFLSNDDTLLGKLAELLGIDCEHISYDLPIISYGLDSLTGMQLLGWIHEKYKKEIDLSFLLQGTSLRQLEEAINRIEEIENQTIASKRDYPISWNQESIWTFLQLNPKSLAYNIHFAFDIKGPFEILAFKEAVKCLINRHSQLRVFFKQQDNCVVQCEAEEVDLPFYVYHIDDVQNLLDSEVFKKELAFSFNLSTPPLFRICLFQYKKRNTIFFNFHHIICDGWSINIIIKELEQLYADLCCGRKIEMPKLQQFYSSFVEWQSNLYNSLVYKDIGKKWQEKLQESQYNCLNICPFRTEQTNDVHEHLAFVLQKEKMDQLRKWVQKEKITIPIALNAVFHAILHIYSGEKKIFVGFPSVNRLNGAFQKIVGLFINTLICKTHCDRNTTFLDLIEQIKEFLWLDGKSLAYPFSHLLHLLRPPRYPNSTPLFQAMFVVQNAPIGMKKFANLDIEMVKLPSSSALYDLVLEIQENDEQIELIFEYQKEKITPKFIKEIKNCYVKLLDLALQFPNYPIEKLPLTSRQFTGVFGSKKYENIVNSFEHVAKNYATKTAILSDIGNFTYKELSDLAKSIATHLLKRPLSSNEIIGICLEKEPMLVASLLGILKAGCTYMPIDPAYPKERIQSMVEDAHIRFIITRKNFHTIFSFFQGELIDLGFNIIDPLETYPEVPEEAPAYVIYTSGSTGKPKGVVVSHKSLSNFVTSAIDFFEMHESDRALQFSSISWDTSSEEIYPCLLSGGTLVLRSSAPLETFGELLERTKKYEVTTWNLPSSYWHDLVVWLERKKLTIPQSLRLVIVGGERVDKHKVKLWIQKIAPNVKLLNTYGATEATSISAVFDLSCWRSEWIDVPIGFPIANVELYILNPSLEFVPPGVVGDLYIGGLGVAVGYLKLPELTESKFIVHPQTKERMYATGDLAYRTLTGEILLKGRRDRQIKRRGFRIELEEVENTFLNLEGVEQTYVLCEDDKIKAYVVFFKSFESKDIHVLKTQLREKLPEYLIPDLIFELQEIPRLPNGKIDLEFLKKHEKCVQSCHGEVLTLTEEILSNLWKSILKIETFSKEKSFFDIGGHSLSMVQLHEMIQETFSIQINISLLFSYFTLEAQAQKIDEIKGKRSKLSKLELLKLLEQGLISKNEAREMLK